MPGTAKLLFGSRKTRQHVLHVVPVGVEATEQRSVGFLNRGCLIQKMHRDL